jgi:general secretion pathway protein J
MTSHRRTAEAGFSLIEALVAVALMSAVLAALATVTAQWLPNWRRGFVIVQQSELLEVGLERLVADLSAAAFVPPGGNSLHPLFVGNPGSIVFVRTALGPNTRPGLEVVRIAEPVDDHGPVLVRSRARFTPLAPDAPTGTLPTFKDPVVVLHAPYRVSFSYAGKDGKWKRTWEDKALLPRAIRIIVRDSATQLPFSASTIAMIHVDASAVCGSAGKASDCGHNSSNGADVNTADTLSTDADSSWRGQR